MTRDQQVCETIAGRDTYAERIGDHALYVWQAMGKFHTVRMTNGGVPDTMSLPGWAQRFIARHANEIRPWFGFTNERADLPWESYKHADRPLFDAAGYRLA